MKVTYVLFRVRIGATRPATPRSQGSAWERTSRRLRLLRPQLVPGQSLTCYSGNRPSQACVTRQTPGTRFLMGWMNSYCAPGAERNGGKNLQTSRALFDVAASVLAALSTLARSASEETSCEVSSSSLALRASVRERVAFLGSVVSAQLQNVRFALGVISGRHSYKAGFAGQTPNDPEKPTHRIGRTRGKRQARRHSG
jgi:hypothetical protein